MEKNYLAKMASLLAYNNSIASPADLTEQNFADRIADFQENNGLFVDGDPGEETLWKLQYKWANDPAQQLTLVKCAADPIQGGYGSFYLREDAALKYQAIKAKVASAGGKVTSSGGLRELSVVPDPNQSAKSMHYPAIAFDLGINSGFFKPDSDNFVIERNSEGKPYWTVWCRAEGGEQKEIRATYWASWNSGVDLTKTVKGKFINFTKLCIEGGFSPISPRTGYLSTQNRKYLSSEWWHFQANSLLIPDLSQLGIELLRINTYNDSSINNANPPLWASRKSIFRRTWA